MTDHSLHAPFRARRPRGAEYWLYFVPILAVALPLVLVRRLAGARPGGGRGLLAAAWAEAGIITSQVLSA